MKIMIGIAHPKQVHFWRNIVNNLINDGHDVKIVAWKKDITQYLLEVYGLEYEIVGSNYKGILKKAYGMLESDLKVLKIEMKGYFRPNYKQKFLQEILHLTHQVLLALLT